MKDDLFALYELKFSHRWKEIPENTFKAVLRNEKGNEAKFLEFEILQIYQHLYYIQYTNTCIHAHMIHILQSTPCIYAYTHAPDCVCMSISI